MKQDSMGIFLKCQHDSTYKDVTTANIILYPALHGDHWCHVVIQLKERRMFYFVSLFDGVGAPTAFLRFMNCMFTSQNKFLDWKDWQYYTILATEIVKGTSPLCSNLKENVNNKKHGDTKSDYDFELPEKWQKKGTGKQIPSMLYPVSEGSPPPYKVRKVKTTHMLRMEIMLAKFPL